MKKILLLTALLSFFMGCALTPSKKEPQPASPTVKSQLKKIEGLIKARSYKTAMQQLRVIAKKHPGTDAEGEAHVMMGEIFCKVKDYTNCYKAYISVLDSEYYSPREVDATLGASEALYKLGRYDEALGLTDRALKARTLTPTMRMDIQNMRYQILVQTGDRIQALKALAYLAEHSPSETARSKYKIRASEIIESNLKESDLQTIAEDKAFGSFREVALFKVGSMYFEQRDYSRAEHYFSNLKSLAPESDLAAQADKMLQQIAARRRVDPLVIGAVLPLSGKYASVGYRTLHGLQLGLGIAQGSSSNFKLAVIDSAGNPDTARRAVERLVVEDSAIAIVGDVVSRTAEAVAQKCDELGVPNIALSQKARLTDVGDYVFRNALTSQAIVRELVRAAMDEHGMKKFGILYPNDPYGVEYANLFWDEVLARGGEIRGAQAYPSKSPDLRGPVRRLVGTFFLEDRLEELTFLLKDWYSKQKVINARTQAPDDLLAPIVDYDAIFVPDSVNNTAQVASMLLYNDVSNVRLLGTNLWNTKDLISHGTKLIENSLFVDARTSVNEGFKSTDFYRRFKAVYGDEPSVFEAQAYDSALALRQLVASGTRSRSGLRDSLARLSDFTGAVGEISVDEDREFLRPLTVLTVHDGHITPAASVPETTAQ